MAYEITFHENAPDDEIKVLSDGLEAYVEELFPGKSRTYLSYFVRDENGEIVGGVTGNYGTFRWLYVSMLWVRKDLRGRGFGRELMNRIEAEAIKHHCKNAFLNTMSFQAPDFYKKLGYEVFAELDNFPNEHSMVYLRKRLT
jgi:GNAT superfamily N-acetyltransferase